ncbi:MAG TPA: aromatic ring-hydroxylating dioxygenase subunit alpha [Polyangiaceae bacterium]|jgi:phenylpropionate dioxygenase-like ring-hydroxylating dioxygenase large terminal subunit
MRTDVERDILARLLAQIESPSPATLADATVPTRAYTSPERAAAERALFRRVPLAVAHASEVPEAGAFVTRDVAGFPLLLARDEAGEVGVFANVCRHRGTRLVDAAAGKAKAFACRYHAWTYDLRGRLTHVPHRETFPSLAQEGPGLVRMPSATRHGVVWATLTPGAAVDARAVLGSVIDDDFAAFGLSDHVVMDRKSERRACNWKLVIEAFLEGYHARFLHQRTLARFFVDGGVVSDRLGANTRSAGARKEILALEKLPPAERTVRAFATMFYFVFPNTIVVVHPDWVSHITMTPRAEGESTYTHTMLVPRDRVTDADRSHWRATWDLIEEKVFQTEDLSVADSIQASLAAGVDLEFRIGGLEMPIRWFHDALEEALRLEQR